MTTNHTATHTIKRYSVAEAQIARKFAAHMTREHKAISEVAGNSVNGSVEIIQLFFTAIRVIIITITYFI